MKKLIKSKKMSLIELILCFVIIGEFIAGILFTFLYAPGMTNVDVAYGLRYGFIDYFKVSIWKMIIGISALIIVLLFSAYWIAEIYNRRFKTLGPIYLILFLIVVVFLNGYYNVVNKFEGMMAINVLLALTLLINCVYSFICYVKYVEKLGKE